MANEGSKSGAPDLGAAVNGLTEGRKLFGNHYTLIKIVGRSANSVVWLAWNDKQQRDVALKFLPEVTKQDASALAVLKREIRKLQEIKHPVFTPIYDVEEEGTLVAIASEYVEGATLSEMRSQKSNQIFAPADLTESVKQLCTALEYGHTEANHAHGGLTSSNLMVSQKGAFRVTDFALGRHVAEYISKTTEGRASARNLAYLSPQQANGEPAGTADDIYSFGATIYELLTSKPPFYTGDIMLQVQQKIPPPMTHRRKELRVIGEPIPRVWEETVASCLQKTPANRPQTITQVREMLGIAADAPAAADAPVAEVAAPSGPSPKAKIIGVAVAAVVICGLLAAILAKNSKTPTGGGGGMTAAEQAKMKAAQEEAVKKATKDAEKNAEAKASAAAEKLRKEADAKLKAAEAAAANLQRQMEKAKQDEAKRSADAEAARKLADAKLKKAEEDAAKLKKQQEEAAKMASANTSANSAEAERIRKEADAKLKAMQEESAKLQAAIEKQKADEAKRIADAAKAQKEADDKIKAAAAEQERLKQQLKQAEMAKENVELVKMAAIEAEKAKKLLAERRAEEEKRAADMKAKEDAEAKQLAMLNAKAKADADAKKAAQAEARKFKPGSKQWDNSLGMRLAQVGKNYVGIWEVRYDDYATFVNASRYDAGLGWKGPGFKQGPTHPVVNVSWSDAQAFCRWLTEKEKSEGLFTGGTYRLPTDTEWSTMARLEGESGATPAERDGKVKGVYPWGNQWPPPVGAGNYQDNVSFDQFEETAPVGSFRPNALGLYDLGGNVWEWVDDWADGSQKARTMRGGSWTGYVTGSMLTSNRGAGAPTERRNDIGFRVVLEFK